MTQKIKYPEQVEGIIGLLGVAAQDEGIPLGTGTVFNFVGPNVDASISGTVVRVFVSGTPGFNDAQGLPAEVTISGSAAYGTSIYPSRRDHMHHLAIYEVMDQMQSLLAAGGASGININYVPTSHGFNFDVLTLSDIRYMKVDGWTLINYTGTYVSADSPSYKVSFNTDLRNSVEIGMKFRCIQSASTKHFFITDITGSVSSTTLTLYGGTDYTLTSGTITSPCFSQLKKPTGFPIEPSKWTVSLVVSGNQTQTSPVVGTYYNLGSQSLVMPVGCWNVDFQANGYLDRASAATMIMQFGISTSNNSVSDNTLVLEWAIGSIALLQQPLFVKPLPITRTTKATYYILGMSNTSGAANLIIKNIVLQFVCAYL